MSPGLVMNTVFLGLGTTLLAVPIGLLAGLALGCMEPGRGRMTAFGAVICTLVVPPFLMTNVWLQAAGHAGWMRPWLPAGASVYSLPGAILLLASQAWAISALAVSGELSRFDRQILELEPGVHGWMAIRTVLLPACRVAWLPTAVATFVLAINQFSIPTILQVQVVTDELWIALNNRLDAGEAWLLSLPQLVLTASLLVWMLGPVTQWRPNHEPLTAGRLRILIGPIPHAVALGTFGAGTLLGLIWPFAALVLAPATWSGLPSAFTAGLPALAQSVLNATAAATLILGISIALARRRWRRLLWLPFCVPGTLTGLALVPVFSRWDPLDLGSTPLPAILALAIRYAAPASEIVARAVASLDPDLEDDARIAGAGRWHRFWSIVVPQIFPTLSIAWMLGYLLTLWDAETILPVLQPGGETLSTRAFNLLHYGYNNQVNGLSMVLLLVGLLPLVLLPVFRHGVLGRRPVTLGSVLPVLTGLSLAVAGCSNPSSPLDRSATLQSPLFERVEVIGSRGTGPGQFNKPRSLVVDSHDCLYVADMTGRIQKFGPEGGFQRAWEMEQTDKGKPKGMAMDPLDHILVVEPHYSRVNAFTPEGVLVRRWGSDGTNVGQLGFPRSIAVTPSGEVWVSEYGRIERVQRFTADGTRALLSIGTGPGSKPGLLNRAEGIAVDGTGRLFVADSCNHRIQVFGTNGSGTPLAGFGSAGLGAGQLSYPYDVKVDADGRVFVCEFGNSRVQVFDAAFRPLEILGGPGTAPDRMNNPWSIALDRAGNLYVADALNHRVLRFVRRRTGRTS